MLWRDARNRLIEKILTLEGTKTLSTIQEMEVIIDKLPKIEKTFNLNGIVKR